MAEGRAEIKRITRINFYVTSFLNNRIMTL